MRSYETTHQPFHTDQVSIICEYVVVEDKEGDMQESLLGFTTEHRKIAYDIKKMILGQLEKEKLDFENEESLDLTMQLVWLEFMVVFNVFYETQMGKLNLSHVLIIVLPRPAYERKHIRLHLRPREITPGYGRK